MIVTEHFFSQCIIKFLIWRDINIWPIPHGSFSVLYYSHSALLSKYPRILPKLAPIESHSVISTVCDISWFYTIYLRFFFWIETSAVINSIYDYTYIFFFDFIFCPQVCWPKRIIYQKLRLNFYRWEMIG